MFSKKTIVVSAIVAFVFGFGVNMIINNINKKNDTEINSKSSNTFIVTNYENIKYKIKFNPDSIEVNDVKYYIKSYDALIIDIKRTERKDFPEIQTIVSEYVIEKDGTNNKYDIYCNEATQYDSIIILYKFIDELDDTYDMPSFEVQQMKELLIKANIWK